MVAVYRENQRESTDSLTMIVIAWPAAPDHRATGPDPTIRDAIEVHAEDEPTWEDAAWM